jgi:hypothetical protein
MRHPCGSIAPTPAAHRAFHVSASFSGCSSSRYRASADGRRRIRAGVGGDACGDQRLASSPAVGTAGAAAVFCARTCAPARPAPCLGGCGGTTAAVRGAYFRNDDTNGNPRARNQSSFFI